MVFTSVVQDKDNNKSIVSYRVTGGNPGKWYLYGYAWWYSTDGGSTWNQLESYNSTSNYVTHSTYTKSDWKTGLFEVQHNNDGTSPDVRIRMRMLYRWGANSSRWAMTEQGGNGEKYNAYQAISSTITLETIPRTGLITNDSIVTTYTGNAAASSTINATINNPANFYLKAKVFATLSDFTNNTPTKTINLGQATSLSFTLNTAEMTNLINKIGISAGATATIQPLISIETYSDSGYATNIGNVLYQNWIINLSGMLPTISSIVLGDASALSRTLTGNTTSAVNNIVKTLTSIDYLYTIVLKNGATISSAIVNNKSATINNNTVSGTIEPLVSNTINAIIKDSRGNELNSTQTKTLKYDIPLNIATVSVARTSNVVANEVKIIVTGDYWTGNFGSQSNTLTCGYKIWKSGEAEPANYTNFNPTIDTATNKFTAETTVSNIDYKYIYNVRLKLNDKVISRETPSAEPRIIGRGLPVVYWTKEKFGVNGDVEIGKTGDTNKLYLNGIEVAASPAPDTAMSNTSENAVQNKVIKAYVDDLVYEKGSLKLTHNATSNKTTTQPTSGIYVLATGTIDISKDDAKVLVVGTANRVYISGNCMNFKIRVDNSTIYTLGSSSNSDSMSGIYGSAIITLDKGTHTIDMGFSTDRTDTSRTITISSYNSTDVSLIEL